MFITDLAGARHWSSAMSTTLVGVVVKDDSLNPVPYIEEAEVLSNQIAVDVGDRVLFYRQ